MKAHFTYCIKRETVGFNKGKRETTIQLEIATAGERPGSPKINRVIDVFVSGRYFSGSARTIIIGPGKEYREGPRRDINKEEFAGFEKEFSDLISKPGAKTHKLSLGLTTVETTTFPEPE
jgi:hypothetical protein